MTKVSIHIILLFTIAMLTSFIPEYFPDFFGDVYCEIVHCGYGGNIHDYPTVHWGYRHWLYFAMGLSLFVLQVSQIIKKLSKL